MNNAVNHNIEEIQRYLLQSPIYAMSLSSKELFHSNFWAWLIETKPAYASVFFPEISVEKIKRVSREEGNRDITIWLEDGSAYIIENKLKSVPYKEQLDKYTAALKSFKGGLLSGVISCKMPNNWSFKNYQVIGNALKEKAEELEENEFRKELIKEYANTIVCIYEFIVKTINGKYDEKFVFGNIEDGYAMNLRFDDVIKKIQAEKLKIYIEEKVGSKLKAYAPNAQLMINCGYSRKEAMVNIFYEMEEYNIGVTIQGAQFRRVISGNGTPEMIFAFGKEKGYFQNREDLRTFRATTMEKDYCKFAGSIEKSGTNKNTHVYQHWTIQDAAFASLAKEIVTQMQIAAECI